MEAPGSARKAAARRRASRAAGPASPDVATMPAQVVVESPSVVHSRPFTPVGPPPRRQPHRMLVAGLALGVTAVLVAALSAVVAILLAQQRHAQAANARDQQFVDAASQTVVNMFSYTQDTIDDSVNRFVNGISGPLRDMMSQGNNVENLKAIFRDTNASSEAVINGAALEKVDDTADNASVLVSVRVTVTNLDGVNSPSKPYRLRVIVHEDDNGHMTGYDLKYPDGGN
ncbi:mammalian cell entry protein [Mycolicibacterium sp.]|uniref:mammalian cell entry protein n=1 Tax=Mycolicibacterium sp. TaxID=2320850 RepID=UPI001A1CC03D|nr:mammalian cell entry protein [Mycolicibacterium sp.]MBJ7339740.1 mammalian cell entry protein [Mycolicibacterium sp.]